MRRGFTIIEMMMALSIGVIILMSIGGILTSVWMIAKESSDELQCVLHARSLREHYFYNLQDPETGKLIGTGLSSATNIVFSSPELIAQFKGRDPWETDIDDDKEHQLFMLDRAKRSDSDFRNGKPLQFVYMAVEIGKATYYDRMVVPIFGKQPDDEDMEACFGL